MFGAGGGTSSYEEIRTAELIVLWGSNARETHPIFFHHVLKALHGGARLVVVDPRRSASAQWADLWLGLDVGADIALANAMGREIIEARLANETFIERATEGFDAYRELSTAYAPTRRSGSRCRPPRSGRRPTRTRRQAARRSAGRSASPSTTTPSTTSPPSSTSRCSPATSAATARAQPLRGQNNVQGGGDMGALPNRLPGFALVEDDEARALRGGVEGDDPAEGGSPPERHVRRDGAERAPRRSRARREPRAIRGGPAARVRLLEGSSTSSSRTSSSRGRASSRTLLLAAASWCEGEGTVTSSERRVQRVRKALDPPGEARDDIWILCELARRLGHDVGVPTAEEAWNELRSLSPMHAGMSYERLEANGGLQWPCPDEQHPGELFLHAALGGARPGPASAVPPVPLRAAGRRARRELPDPAHDRPASRLLQHRRPEPRLHLAAWRGEAISSPRRTAGGTGSPTASAYAVSRRGAVEAPVLLDPSLRPGLAFMTLHFPDEVATNVGRSTRLT